LNQGYQASKHTQAQANGEMCAYQASKNTKALTDGEMCGYQGISQH